MKTVPLEENGQGDHLSDRYFNDAIHNLVSLVGAKGTLDEKAAEGFLSANLISAALERATQGYVKVITCNNEKFVILTADQVMALNQNTDARPKRTMRELYPNLPSLPYSEDRPRYSPLAGTVDHLRYRSKE